MKKKKLALTMAIAITLTVSSISGSMPTIVYAQENTNAVENEEKVVESDSEENALPKEKLAEEETDLSEENLAEKQNLPAAETENMENSEEADSNAIEQNATDISVKEQKINDVNVSTEAELRNALTGTNTDVIITVINDIELTSNIVLSGARNIVLQGKNNSKIIFNNAVDNMTEDVQRSVFYFEQGANISMTVQNIVIDGGKTARLFYLGNSQDNSQNCLKLEDGAILQNGYPQVKTGTQPSGGAIRLGANSHFIMNGGKIINNQSNRYGGGIYGWVSGATVEINDGEISGNTGQYAGGIVMLGTSKLYLRGGKITGNKGTTVHGGGIFLQDGELHISKQATVIDNERQSIKSNIYLNNSNEKIYIDSALTGVVAFDNLDKIDNIQAYENYILTENDARHLASTGGQRVFYLNVIENLIKHEIAKTVTFESNIDSKSYQQKVPLNVTTTLDKNPFVYEGFKFKGWNTERNGSGTSYVDECEIAISEDLTLFAQWEEKTVPNISFKDTLNLDKTYDGKAVSISENAYTLTDGAGNVTFSYQVKNGDAWADVSDVPTNVGTYRVKAVVAENDNYKGAETDWKEFIIRKATPAYTLPNDLVVGKGKTLATVTLPKGFTWADETQTADELGTYKFKAVYTPEDTANYETVEVMIAVEVVPNTSLINHAPEIEVSDRTLTVGDEFDPMENVVVKDKEDSADDLVVDVTHHVDTSKAGIYEVTYKVTDTKGAVTTKTITVTVKEKSVDKPTTSGKPDHTTKPDGTTKAKKAGAPKTGDMTNVGVFASMLAGSSGVLAVLLGKRRKDNKNK